MFTILLLCLLNVGDDHVPDGQELPNKDELVSTFRQQVARFLEPKDNYSHRRVQKGNRFLDEDILEEVNGQYYRKHSRGSNGTEWITVKTPSQHFRIFRYPGAKEWRLHSNGSEYVEYLDPYMSLSGYGHVGLPTLKLISERLLEKPVWTFTKVTAEHYDDAAVYRFYYKREYPVQPAPMQLRSTSGFFEVDPKREWAILRWTEDYPQQPSSHQEVVFTYDGAFAGLPAVKRIVRRNCERLPDGSWRYTPLETIEVQIAEHPTFDASEYTLDHYGLGPPYRAYVGLGATAVLAVGWVYAFSRWLRKRRARGLTWATSE